MPLREELRTYAHQWLDRVRAHKVRDRALQCEVGLGGEGDLGLAGGNYFTFQRIIAAHNRTHGRRLRVPICRGRRRQIDQKIVPGLDPHLRRLVRSANRELEGQGSFCIDSCVLNSKSRQQE